MAFQDRIRDNYCWGCGADNPVGLQLKSDWDDSAEDVAIASWTPRPDFAAGPRHLVNGGIIATILDCHAVCTAMADAYRREGREIGSDPDLWFATASMRVDYLRPTPIDAPLQLRATVVGRDERRTVVDCFLGAAGKERARAAVEAVRVPLEWKHGSGRSSPPSPPSSS